MRVRLALLVIMLPTIAAADPVFSVGAGIRAWRVPAYTDDLRHLRLDDRRDTRPVLELTGGAPIYGTRDKGRFAIVGHAAISAVSWAGESVYNSMAEYRVPVEDHLSFDLGVGVRFEYGRWWVLARVGGELDRVHSGETYFREGEEPDLGAGRDLHWETTAVGGLTAGVDIYREAGIWIAAQDTWSDRKAFSFGLAYRR